MDSQICYSLLWGPPNLFVRVFWLNGTCIYMYTHLYLYVSVCIYMYIYIYIPPLSQKAGGLGAFLGLLGE